MAIAEMPLRGADTRPVPGTPAAVPGTRAAVPDAPPIVPGTPAVVPGARPIGSLTQWQQITAGVTVLAALVLSGIGLYLSFEHVAAFAHERLRFQTLGKAQLFTVGVDVGILVLIAVDLLMAWLRRPIGWVRYPVWALTGATIVLNAASAAPEAGPWRGVDYVAAFAHGMIPFLFIVVVEVGKTAIERVVRPDSDQPRAGVPLHRWFLAPLPTLRLWRRMRMWAVPTYAEAVAREQALTVYRVLLQRKYDSVRKAPPDLRLPITMAPYGLTIEEALALPRQAREQEAGLREAQEAARIAASARADERAAEAEIARLRTNGRVEAARHTVAASTEQAAVAARADLVAAERAAEGEAQAMETAAAAEAEARRAVAEKAAAEARQAAAETNDRAAGIERAAAEAAERAAGIRERAAAADRRAADDEAAAQFARQRAADVEWATAETRLRVAEVDRRAAEVEDEARMSQRERTVRKLARTALLDHGGDVEAIPLETVAERFGVSTTTASDYRRDARALVDGGYRPEGI